MLWSWDLKLVVMNSEWVELEAVTSESGINGGMIDVDEEGNAEFKHSDNITEDKGQLAEKGSCLF